MNYNVRDDMDMNDNWQNGDVKSVIGFIIIRALSQYNEPSNFNYMNMGVENGDANSGDCYMNIRNGSKSNNCDSIYSAKEKKHFS